MSNATDEAARKAAEEAAAKKAAAKKAKDEGEKRSFRIVHNVLLAGELHAAGTTIDVSREEHATLFAGGSVADGWDD